MAIRLLLATLSVFALSLTAEAAPAKKKTTVNQACINTHVAAGFHPRQGAGLCWQYTNEEKRCLVAYYRQTRDIANAQGYCLSHSSPSYPSYGDSPYPWARSGGGFCDNNPGNISCQHDHLLNWGY